VVGLPGLATARTLVKYAVECGVGASLRAFARRYGEITKLLTVSTPLESLLALARYRAQTPQTRLARARFYTFGGFERTARWVNRVLDGNLEPTQEGALV